MFQIIAVDRSRLSCTDWHVRSRVEFSHDHQIVAGFLQKVQYLGKLDFALPERAVAKESIASVEVFHMDVANDRLAVDEDSRVGPSGHRYRSSAGVARYATALRALSAE